MARQQTALAQLRPTAVLDTFFRFAHERQLVFLRRAAGQPGPWTEDEIISNYRFTNPYRASDRVSQYLIKNVIYTGSQQADEVLFRILLFKFFNRIETWEHLEAVLGDQPTYATFTVEKYDRVLSSLRERQSIYSGAYIMPSPAFGQVRKHTNHLELLSFVMKNYGAKRVGRCTSLKELFELFLSFPSLGNFLAFQFAIDVNYSDITNFSEMDFVVAGPGALDGISKCFAPSDRHDEAEVIRIVAEAADDEFQRLGLPFQRLGGTRRLQLIDIQNLFCEISKYARVAHPDVAGSTGRTRIKQRFHPNVSPLPQYYPPKWRMEVPPLASSLIEEPTGRNRKQRSLGLVFPADHRVGAT